MPTLPGRATSILAVLSGFSHVGRRALLHFDWPALVEEARPGSATDVQRRQAARFARVQEDLARWVEHQALPADHVEESSLYATVSTPPEMAHEQTMAVARTICWIYAIDDFLDKLDLRQAPPAERNAALARLDRDLRAVFSAVAPHTRHTQMLRFGLAQPRSAAMPTDAAPLGVALREALRSLFVDLRAQWEPLPSAWGRGRFRLRTAAEQFAACVAMMRQELHWNLALDNRAPQAPRLPSFARYIQCGAVSIGMPAVASVAAGFEARPRRVWRAALRATDAAGRIVRLTNDLHTYEADVEEGKVTAIAIRLRDLGYPPMGLDPATSPEVQRAQAWVSDDLARVIALFSRHQAAVPPGPLSYYLRHSVAFALAVYGDGSRFKREAMLGA